MNRSLPFLLLALMAPSVALAVPLQLAHHGQLLDTQGDPITDQESITFRLWDAAEDGNEVWSEVIVVDVVAGHYSALLSLGELGRDVLKAEPSLWLELEIVGETLAPRQPVAATPYALVADTAENVDGGTVNATSISVNGTTVIDASGTWTGDSGSITWGALTDVPAGLDDGDADTLGGLSCVDGDRAVWNAGLGQWECGSSVVELDRLDTAGAVDGDLLSFDGVGVAWQAPGSPTGACILDDLDETSATLDCDGQPLRLALIDSYLGISGGVGLRNDGSWVGVRYGVEHAASGIAIALGAFEMAPSDAAGQRLQSAGCAALDAGGLRCWGLVAAISSAVSDRYTAVACGHRGVSASSENAACCARNDIGIVSCWDGTGAQVGTSLVGTTDGLALAFGGSDWGACGFEASGEIACSGSGAQTNAPPGTGYSGLATGGRLNSAGTATEFCAIDPGGQPWSWSETVSAVPMTLAPGNYSALGAACSCGLTDSGVLNCEDNTTYAGLFDDIDATGAWALRTGGSLSKLRLHPDLATAVPFH